MPLSRKQKIELEKEYSSLLDNASSVLVFDYRGLTVEEISDLRNKVRDTGAVMLVVKNRMMKRAVGDRPYAELKDHFIGPSAMIFAGEDPVSPAKALMDFVKGHEVMEIKGGVVDEDYMDKAQVEQFSRIPGKNELYAMILGGIKAPSSSVLGCVKGLHQKLFGLIKAYTDKLDEAA